MFHGCAENHRLKLLPLAGALGHGDEIGAEEHAADTENAEQPFRQRRLRRLIGVADFKRAVVEDWATGQEFEGRRIRRRFGLDEHDKASGAQRVRYTFGQRKASLIRGELRWKFKG